MSSWADGSLSSTITLITDLADLLCNGSECRKVFEEVPNMLGILREKIVRELRNLEKEKDSIEKELLQFKKLHRVVKIDKTEFQDELLISQAECGRLKKEIEELRGIQEVTNEEVRSAEKKDQIISKLKKELGIMLEKQGIMESVQETLKFYEAKVKRLERENESLNGQILVAGRTIEEMKTEQSKIELEKKMLSELDNQILESRKEVKELNDHILLANQEIANMKCNEVAAKNTIEEMERDTQAANEEYQNLKREKLAAEGEIERMKTEKVAADQKMEEMKVVLSKYYHSIKTLQHQILEVIKIKDWVGEVLVPTNMDGSGNGDVRVVRSAMSIGPSACNSSKRTFSDLPKEVSEKQGAIEGGNSENQNQTVLPVNNSQAEGSDMEKEHNHKRVKRNSYINEISDSDDETENLMLITIKAENGITNGRKSSSPEKKHDMPFKRNPLPFSKRAHKNMEGPTNFNSVNADNELYSTSYVRIENQTRMKKWMSKAEMENDLKGNDELCMMAVCALYRYKLSHGLSAGLGLFEVMMGGSIDIVKFLINGDTDDRLRRSVSEVKDQRPGILVICKELAIQYSERLFLMYANEEDPWFKYST